MSTTDCASRPACRQVAAHRSLYRLAPLPPLILQTQPACRPLLAQVGRRVDKWLCIAQCVALRFCLNLIKRVRKRVHQCLRKSASESTITCASLRVSHSVSASTSPSVLTSVLTTACASRPPCWLVAALISVSPNVSAQPLLATHPSFRPLLAKVDQRVDQWLDIAHCVA